LDTPRVHSHSAAFHQALALHNQGNAPRAERLLRRIVRVDPQHADAWHRLGIVESRAGRPAEAVTCLSRAVVLDGHRPEFHRDLGAVCLQLGRVDEAADHLQQAVHLDPDDAHLHFNLGVVLHRQGNLVGARLRFEFAARLRPEMIEAWNNLGMVQHLLGDLERAAECFERVCALAPENADGHFNLGTIRLEQKRPREALACCAAALERQPRMAEALNNMGTALSQLGQIDAALESYRLSARMQPGFAPPLNNRGLLLSSAGYWTEAETCLREALALEPRNASTLNNLATLLQLREQLDQAEPLLRQAVAIEPNHAHAWGNLAGVLQLQGHLEESRAGYAKSLVLAPNNRLRLQKALMLPPVYGSLEEVGQFRASIGTRVTQLIEQRATLDPARELLPTRFLLAYQGFNDVWIQRSIERLFTPAPPVMPSRVTNRDGRTRVGFLSRYLGDHTIGDLMRGMIASLDRQAFHVTYLAVGGLRDQAARALARSVDTTVLLPDAVTAARQSVRDADLDVLCYPEIGMDPLTFTLAHSRLAAAQCVTYGHPVTTGIDTIDYFVSSEAFEGDAPAGHYSEKLVKLRSLGTCYAPPRLTGPARSAESLGLPDDGTIYLCPQSLFKMHPEFDPLLAEILRRDPRARLVLIAAPNRHWTETLSRRFTVTLRGALDRVHFVNRLDRPEFLHLLASARVMLDPLHFGGGNTSFQALGLGIPVVTLPTPYLRGRVTLGCYRRMGLTDCLARNAADYIELAVRLGQDDAFHASVAASIRLRSGLLFDDLDAVSEWQEFFRSAATSARRDSRAA
jgi:protein O-GlcNAc transferase